MSQLGVTSQPQRPDPGKELAAPTVLVVDDEESFHRNIAKYLSAFRRINAYTGWQALEALSKHHVDVVLLDLNLPDTTGFHVLEQIRKESPTALDELLARFSQADRDQLLEILREAGWGG